AALSFLEKQRLESAEEDKPLAPFVRECYEGYVHLLMGKQVVAVNQAEALAFEASERARARSLLGLLAFASTEYLQDTDPELLIRERRLRSKINDATAQTLGAARGTQLQYPRGEEINMAALELEEAQHDIRVQSPSWAKQTASETLNLAAVQAQLDSDTVLIEYMLSESRSYLWILSQRVLRSVGLPSRAQIEGLAKEVHTCLIIRNRWSTAECERATTQLRDLILAPAAEVLKYKRILIVADGALQFVPFASL